MLVEEWLGSNNKLGIDIWKNKYCFNNESFDAWIDRISNNDIELADLIKSKKFLFGGRILSNRGLYKKGLKVTYSNCYVLTPPEDNLESIFDCAKALARTFSYGGGCGIDISKLAPKNAKVNNTARHTTGSISFMDLYSMITGLIGQNGRRGALMISIDCSHPDLEDFITIKSDLNKVTKANISIRINDDFMRAVLNNTDYTMEFTRHETNEKISKTVNARKLFHKLAKMNWDYAEPGCLFWNRIEAWNLLSNTDEFQYSGTNPCAEEPLPAGGSCLLGSINLAEFVVNPFTDNPTFDYESFKYAAEIAVKALNDVLDEGLALHPLQDQRESVRNWRQIGLGILGLADMLIKMGIRYGSKLAVDICDKIGFVMIDTAIKTSALMAKEKGCFPKCCKSEIASTEFIKYNTSKETLNLVKQYGLYNSQLLTIAPTGSLSTMLGVSGGIEPIFANYYERKTESLHGKDVYYKVYTHIVDKYMKQNNLDDDSQLPEYFVTAQTLNYRDRIDMQSIWQTHIDAAISSTVNVPNEFTIKDTEDLYIYAHKSGLKGITIFRDGCKRAGILVTKATENSNTVEYDSIQPISRKAIGTTHGSTYCKKCACGTLYITINRDINGNIVECFAHTSKGGVCQANISAVNRMASLAMRSGVKIAEIVDQLKGINCPACIKVKTRGDRIDGLSCPDIISRTLEEFINTDYTVTLETKQKLNKSDSENLIICPDCSQELQFEEGCVICPNCGFSKCQ